MTFDRGYLEEVQNDITSQLYPKLGKRLFIQE